VSSSTEPQRRARDYRPLLAVTLWTAGLLLALVFGMVSAYVVVSAIFVGSKLVGRMRALAGRAAGDPDPGREGRPRS